MKIERQSSRHRTKREWDSIRERGAGWGKRGRRRMEEGEVEEKRVEKEENGMAVCSKQRTVTRARGVRDVEYVWRMWRSLYTPPGSLWGHSGFWYVISEIPVYLCVACCPCAMFQLERAKRAPRAMRKWYYLCWR